MAKEQTDETASGAENVRRVYALPAEMVDRITKFQREKGLSSEVEAVRRLLDDALKSRDTLQTLINRLLSRLGQTKIVAEAARDVLAGHPQVYSIQFANDCVNFRLKNDDAATVYETGYVSTNSDLTWQPIDPKNLYAGGSFDLPF